MSKEIATIKKTGKFNDDMTLTQFNGGPKGIILQVNQTVNHRVEKTNGNNTGFIHLTPEDAMALAVELKQWAMNAYKK